MTRSPLIHLAIASVLALIAGGGYAIAYYELGSASARNAALTKEVADKRAQLSANTEAEGALTKASARRDVVESYFVSPNDVVSFLEKLESTGTALGSKVSVISVSQNDKPRPNILVALRIEGGFIAVMRTLGVVEYGPYDATVSTLTLDTDTNAETGKSLWRAALSLSVGTASSTATTTKP